MVETHLDVNRVQIKGLEFPFFSDGNEKGIGRNQTEGRGRRKPSLVTNRYPLIDKVKGPNPVLLASISIFAGSGENTKGREESTTQTTVLRAAFSINLVLK